MHCIASDHYSSQIELLKQCWRCCDFIGLSSHRHLCEHLSVIGNPPAMEAALAWYRARGERQPIGPTKVPTLFIWGDADDTVGRISAEGTAEFIAADYRFAALPGVGHYAADQVPEQVNALLLEHIARHPI